MNPRIAAASLVVLCAGCIFGGGVPPAANNGAPDQGVEPGDVDPKTDEGLAIVEYLDLEPEPASCPGDSFRVVSVVSAADFNVGDFDALDGLDPVVGVGGAPRSPELEGTDAYSIAWVTTRETSFGLRVAVVQPSTDGPVLTRQGEVALPHGAGAKVYDVIVAGAAGEPNVMDQIPMYGVTVLTSEGMFSCEFEATAVAPTEVTGACESNAVFDDASRAAQIFPPSRVGVLPLFPDGRFIDNALWILLNSFWIARGGASQDRIGAIFSRMGIHSMPIEDVQTTLLSHEPHATLVPGVDSRAGGFPYITMLARDRDDALQPTVLGHTEGVMRPLVEADWSLPPGFSAEQPFAFASGAQVFVASAMPVGFGYTEYTLDRARGDVRFGYATVNEQGELILSRSGGFTATADFARLVLAAPAQDVFSAQNLVVGDAGQTGAREFGRPLLMLVSGEERERLTLMRWDVGLDLGVAGNVTAGTSVEQISNVKSSLLLINGRGLISFRGMRGGEFVVGTIPIDMPRAITACR